MKMRNGSRFLAPGEGAVLLIGTGGSIVSVLVFLGTLAFTQEPGWALAMLATCIGATGYSVHSLLERGTKGEPTAATSAPAYVARPAVIFAAGAIFGAVVAVWTTS